MDDRDKIIDDWMSGEEIDPCDYDPYQLDEVKRAFGYDEEE